MTQPEITFPYRVVLPKGQWVEFRDPEDVPERKRRLIKKSQLQMALHAGAISQAQATMDRIQKAPGGMVSAEFEMAAEGLAKTLVESGAFESVLSANDLALAALIDKWSYGAEVTVDSILDLSGAAYDALQAAAQPLLPRLSPDFSPSPDPESPTLPSSG